MARASSSRARRATILTAAAGLTLAVAFVPGVAQATPGDPAADATGLKRLRGEVAQAMAQDIDVQFLGALRARSDVRLNPRMLDVLAQP